MFPVAESVLTSAITHKHPRLVTALVTELINDNFYIFGLSVSNILETLSKNSTNNNDSPINDV